MSDEVSILFSAPAHQELAQLDLDVDGVWHGFHDIQNRLEKLRCFGLLYVQDDGLDLDDQVLELCDVPRESGNRPY